MIGTVRQWCLLAVVAVMMCGAFPACGDGGEGEPSGSHGTVSGLSFALVWPDGTQSSLTGHDRSSTRALPAYVTSIVVTATPVDGGDAVTWEVPLATGVLNAELPEGTYVFIAVVETTFGQTYTGAATVTLTAGVTLPAITIRLQVATLPIISGGITVSGGTIYKGQSATLSVTATDPDNDEALTYVWSGSGTFSGSGSSVRWSAPSVTGSYKVSVTVTDERGGSATASRTLSVENHAPTITSVTASDTAPTVGDTVTLTCAATDADGDTLAYTWSGSGGVDRRRRERDLHGFVGVCHDLHLHGRRRRHGDCQRVGGDKRRGDRTPGSGQRVGHGR